jgi:hypothetical protein
VKAQPESQLGRLGWLLIEGCREANLALNVDQLNRLAAAMHKLMDENGLEFVWFSEIERAAAE